ncbi:MAG TPA: helix-turn-helix domain-containing protein [Solirubrobacteraceae bacterium]|nr:helix-turn-helix domain-containing protein [Solirubrobacteraceae bacterium]
MLQTGVGQQGQKPRVHRAWTPLARALAATGDRWTLLIVLALAPARMRLTQLQRRLPGVSTGVLERHLQQMVELELVTRTRYREMPPRVELELTDAGRELLAIAGMLARWGMRNRWSEPGEWEQIDVAALLRMLPELLEEHAGLPEHATLEALVDGDAGRERVRYRVCHGRLVTIPVEHAEQNGFDASTPPAGGACEPPPAASATVAGDMPSWIAALGPAADFGRLRFSGDESLARGLLSALPRLESEAP